MRAPLAFVCVSAGRFFLPVERVVPPPTSSALGAATLDRAAAGASPLPGWAPVAAPTRAGAGEHSALAAFALSVALAAAAMPSRRRAFLLVEGTGEESKVKIPAASMAGLLANIMAKKNAAAKQETAPVRADDADVEPEMPRVTLGGSEVDP